ncbi:MAG: adenine deaminase [Candidatus Izemoplasmatales bacterium]|jgi:adenine deaminase|nr:adenine deaminase [Candidatus Izemoplasmatales bacterium]
MDKDKLRRIALGETSAKLVLKNARIINVFSGTIETADIAIEDGIIAGIGSYEGIKEIDVCFSYVAPGFMDGHVHIESSMMTPGHFARLVMPFGTTTVIADPHEIANVCGLSGIQYMIDSAQHVPLDVKIMIPSCVPSTPFETAGAKILSSDIEKIKDDPAILGLGEMMDYPGVIHGDREVYRKIASVGMMPIDGHAPRLTDKELNAYVLAGMETDHEATTASELEEKVKRGMYVHLREGSQTKNVRDLLGGITHENHSRLLFCTDDKQPEDIISHGHISANINLAIAEGIDPIDAIKMATINIAQCYRLRHIGAIAPGYHADLVVFDDLHQIHPHLVFKNGVIVAKDGVALFQPPPESTHPLGQSVRFNPEAIDFRIRVTSNHVYAIELEKNNVTTKKTPIMIRTQSGYYIQDPASDILKLAVVERHQSSGRVGLGFVKGYGLKKGAIAMTIAHDSHNLIIIGDNDDDMRLSAKRIKEIGGGIVLAHDGHVLHQLPLEVGGLMTSTKVESLIFQLDHMKKMARKLGVNEAIDDPLLQLAFLSLPVIPSLKLTDHGLFDVDQFRIIPLEVEAK